MIQVAVSLYQATNDNAVGASKIFIKAGTCFCLLVMPVKESTSKLIADMDAYYANVETEKLTDIEWMKRAPKIEYES
ncbi:MAG: hypothetical protein R2877_05380 [Bdellovibrionota bacterium]